MTARKSPDAFRTIGEVAAWLGVSAHVLRFWETKFPQIKPVKRAGGRRYYRPQDMALIGGLKQLLHEDGLTIKGAQKVLREKGVKAVAALSPPLEGVEAASAAEAASSDAARTNGAAPDIPPDTTDTVAPPEPLESGPAVDEARPPAEEAAPQTRAEATAETEPGVAASSEAEAAPDDGAEEEASLPATDRAMPPRAPLPGAPDGQLGLFADLPPFPDAPEAEPSPEPHPEPAPADAPPDAPLPDAIAARRPGGLDTGALAALLARAEALRARMAADPLR
ncbi:MAG: MerR family transcriptional regulator [Paracoccaceae bacterium]|jgi:DNA-binding transcriptional MerR regulator|nr:MerR family transcriptional regulator [Paracoccaceae bacterium]